MEYNTSSQLQPITAIQLDAIKSFLYVNNMYIPNDPNEAYRLAYDLIRSNTIKSAPIPVIDWIIALNIFNNKTNIDKYKTSDILTSSDSDLKSLSLSLTLPNVNKERIIRILGYLNRLNNDISIFDELPDDVLKTIIENLDCTSMFLICKLSNRLINYCKSGKLEQILKDKFIAQGLNVKNYNLNKLTFTCNITSRKYPTITGYGDTLFILSDDKIYKVILINEIDKLDDLEIDLLAIENLSNIRQILWNGGRLLALTMNGNIHSINVDTLQHSRLMDINNIVYMIPHTICVVKADGLVYDLKIISSTKHTTDINNSLYKALSISTGVCDTLVLKDDGLVYKQNYFDNKVIEGLDNIVDISAGNCHSLALASDGTVYSWGKNNYGQLGLGDEDDRESPVQIANIDGIVQVLAGSGISLMLTNAGQIYRIGRAFDYIVLEPEIIEDVNDVVELYQTGNYQNHSEDYFDVDELEEIYEFDREIYNFQVAKSNNGEYHVLIGGYFYTFEL